MRTFYVYIMASKAGVLYTGVTSRLEGRTLEHKAGMHEGFSKKYLVHSLVYYESFGEPLAAIARETQIKKYSRRKKVALIDSMNSAWADLAADWFDIEEVEKVRKENYSR